MGRSVLPRPTVHARTAAARLVPAVVGLVALARPAAAHVGGLSGAGDPGPIPLWLVIATGGVVVGASFLFSTFITDHDLMRAVVDWRWRIRVGARSSRVARWLLRSLGLAGLAFVVVVGLVGPSDPFENAAMLIVWAGWWAGFTMAVYLVGDPWPALNPWGSLAGLVRGQARWHYPERFGAWPAVVGLLGLVWLEVVSPVAEDPRLLIGVVLAYTAVTLAGVVSVGAGPWFGRVDPIARVFRVYGRLAPVGRTDGGLAVRVPSAGLVRRAVPDEPGATAFVVALVWVTTFDGLVSTPAWAVGYGPLVELGLPPRLGYALAIVVGFLGFLAVYRKAADWARETAGTYVTADYLHRWFAPSLVPIAAGYHLAHFLGFFVGLVPVAVAALSSPLAPPPAEPLALPDWFNGLQLLFVLGGHIAAVWVAHARSFELFPGVLAPIRSQYPFILVMVFYTMTSLWVVAQPFSPPPYL